MKKHSTLAKNVFKFLWVSLAVGFLSSCMSTTQFASRKYTKGHFSDPIAKVNVDLVPSGANTPTVVTPANLSKAVITQTANTTKVTVLAETRKTTTKQGLTFVNKEKSVKVVVAAPAVINKDNVSLSENSVTAVTDHHGDSEGMSHHGFIWYALVCLILAVLFTILGIAVFIFLVFAYIFWLAFLVFLVLALLVLLGLIG